MIQQSLNFMVLGAASEFWMTRWLTTFWLVGVGTTLGAALLLLSVLIFFVLSKIPILEAWRRSGTAFWIGLALAGGLTIATAFGIKPFFRDRETFYSDEWFLCAISLLPIYGLFCWGGLYGGQSRFLAELYESVTRGVGAYIAGVLVFVSVLGLSCTFLVDEPLVMIQSTPNLFSQGESTETFTIPVQAEGDEATFHPVGLKYDPRYIDRIVISSKQNIILSDGPEISVYSRKPTRVQAREDLIWERRSTAQPPIPMVIGGNVYAQNLEVDRRRLPSPLTRSRRIRRCSRLSSSRSAFW